jgi:LysR family glycine cleavage system transcriptional activator
MKLPPMNSLKAFDAVSRHLSITKAAEEMLVSPGAVSQQIKILEDYLQTPLFVRGTRALSLTRDGAEFATAVQAALTRIAQASEAMSRSKMRHNLTISVPPSFGVRWLIPNLGRFHDLYPDISIAVQAKASLANFAEDGVDAAVRYGHGDYSSLKSDDLFGTDLVIVASPEYLDKYGSVRVLSELENHRLIHYLPPDPRYSGLHLTWEGLLGKRIDTNASHHMIYPEMHMVATAAVHGQGLALMEYILVERELKIGGLLRAHVASFKSPGRYYFVTPGNARPRQALTHFKDWLKQVVGPDATTLAGHAADESTPTGSTTT